MPAFTVVGFLSIAISICCVFRDYPITNHVVQENNLTTLIIYVHPPRLGNSAEDLRRKYVIKTLMLGAAALALSFGYASAQSIGGGLGIVNMQSISGGTVSGGGANGGLTGLIGVTGSQTTQAAGTEGLAGTRLTMDKNGSQLVSEHNVTGFSQQTTVGGSLGGAISGGAGLSSFTGSSLSAGSFTGINGFLGF